MIKSFILAFIFLNFSVVFAATKTETPSQIGAHYPLFTFEKNENPQNIMIIYTKLDKDCRFLPDPNDAEKPFFDFYWLMDKKTYKPVHPMIKSGIRDRLQLNVPKDFLPARNHFEVQINDLKQIDASLTQTQISIESKKSGDACEVEAVANLNPANPEDAFLVTRIYSVAKKKLLPPFREVVSLELDGVNQKTHQKVERKFGP